MSADLREAATRLRNLANEAEQHPTGEHRLLVQPESIRNIAALLDAIAPHVEEIESLGLTPKPGHVPTGYISAARAVAAAVLGEPPTGQDGSAEQ